MKKLKYSFFIIVSVFCFLPSNIYGEEGMCVKGDCRNGNGTITYPSGRAYVGDFKDGKKEGNGTFTHNGYMYIGEWKNDVPHGKGNLTYPDGVIYLGDFKDGIPEGKGEVTLPEGVKYAGDVKNGKRHGYGVEIDANGEKKEGYWENNIFIGKEKK